MQAPLDLLACTTKSAPKLFWLLIQSHWAKFSAPIHHPTHLHLTKCRPAPYLDWGLEFVQSSGLAFLDHKLPPKASRGIYYPECVKGEGERGGRAMGHFQVLILNPPLPGCSLSLSLPWSPSSRQCSIETALAECVCVCGCLCISRSLCVCTFH